MAEASEGHPSDPESSHSQASAAVKSRLSTLDSTILSPAAFSLLERRIEAYITELISESRRVAKRQRADTVSEAHVEQASDHLVGLPRRRLYRHLGTVGGILLGVALSAALSMITTAVYTTPGFTIILTFAVVGTSLITLHISKD